tara:strand:- start:869 stop:1090 length:222 start_codon:yes stop_codon:yes gene_type:complete
MAYEHKENTATVFNNDKKSAENQPDFTGKGKVGEKLMDFAMWKREGKNGNYFYLSFKTPQDKFNNKSNNNDPF